MPPQEQANFVARNLYLEVLHTFGALRHAPSIDPAKFLSAFSIEADGQRVELPDWPNAPRLTYSQEGYSGASFPPSLFSPP